VIDSATGPTARLDVWLWHARVLSTRGACSRLVTTTGVRINGRLTDKCSARLRPGDVLTFAIGTRVRVMRVLALAERRGPATDAAQLYADLVAPQP
jgi:ribosome-associated heat shock protein Hsp15